MINNNNFIDFIFDMKISVPEQSVQWQMKQSKIELNSNYMLNISIKEKLVGYVLLLRYSYGKKV